MESNEEIAPRPLPSWLSIPIILLCLGGGGWIIHWYVMTDSLADESHLLGEVPAMPAQQQQQGGRRGGGFGNGAWVREVRNGGYQIRGNVGTAVANLNDSKRSLQYLRYNNYKSYFPGPDIATIENTRRLVESNDKPRIAAMKLTESQMQKLRGLSQPPEAALTTAQRDEVVAAFAAYRSAPGNKKQDQAEKLRQTVDEVATQAIPATKLQITERAKKINEIVTPEQWKIDKDMGGGQ